MTDTGTSGDVSDTLTASDIAETDESDGPVPAPLRYLRILVYILASLVALSLLVVGTVAIIAQIKGTWHWAIHLESTISYLGAFVARLLVVLAPLTVLLLLGRVRYE